MNRAREVLGPEPEDAGPEADEGRPRELGLEAGCYFICMEYLPGEDFSTVVRTAHTRGLGLSTCVKKP